ncbi:MAG: hypothetical protein ACHRHE_17655 [Tepidisphaerales bacterium]
MESESEQIARRDRLMQETALRMTPEQRIERGRQMHEWAMLQLRANPEAWDRFIRRNLRQRAVPPRDYT